MDVKNKVYIELTPQQKEKLVPLFAKVSRAAEDEEQIMLLAQIHFNGTDAVAICNVTTHDEGLELQRLLSPSTVGKFVGDSYTNRALKKARK